MRKFIDKHWLDIMAAIMLIVAMVFVGNWGRG